MKLEVLTLDQLQQVREWRNNELQFLRTPYLITEKMQEEFYTNVINSRNSKHRYFALTYEALERDISKKHVTINRFYGIGGLTNIEWENGTAEISLIINPEYRGKGKGKVSVSLLLDEAFNNMRLESVYGEVYDCGNRGFWENRVKELGAYRTDLKHRKFHDGKMWDSMWFVFTPEDKK